MKDAGRSAVADDVESVLKWLDINELNTRAGHRPGFGYVDPAEAADEILDEALQPFLDDLQRRASLFAGLVAEYPGRAHRPGPADRRGNHPPDPGRGRAQDRQFSNAESRGYAAS